MVCPITQGDHNNDVTCSTELLVCCVGTGLPGPAGNIGVTGHRWRTAYPGLSGFRTFSGAVERPGASGLYGSRRGMGTTHIRNCFTLLEFYRQDVCRAYAAISITQQAQVDYEILHPAGAIC